MQRQNQNKGRLILGVTGSFASGKSSVAGMFASYGAKVIDADKIAHSVIKPGSSVYKKIILGFGKDILGRNKTIQRRKLAVKVFGNKRLLARLNEIVHPEVIKIIKQKIKSSKDKAIVLDAPLLIEAGLRRLVDKLIVVKITREQQVKRAMKKSGLCRSGILKRISSQIPLSEKTGLADFVIDNSGTIAKTRKQVTLIRRKLWKS